MVAHLERELGLSATLGDTDGILLRHPVGRRGIGQVRNRVEQRLASGLGLVHRELGSGEIISQRGGSRNLGCRVASGLLRLADRLSGRVARRSQLVDRSLQLAPDLVELEQAVELSL